MTTMPVSDDPVDHIDDDYGDSNREHRGNRPRNIKADPVGEKASDTVKTEGFDEGQEGIEFRSFWDFVLVVFFGKVLVVHSKLLRWV